MDSRTRSDEDPIRESNSFGADREERLLRFVDNLRTEQVRASIEANAEGGRTGLRGPLLAVVVTLMGAAAGFLQTSGPSHIHPDVPPEPRVGTALVQSAPGPVPSSQPALPPKIAQSRPPEGVGEVDAPADRPANLAPIRPVPEPHSLSNPHPSESALAGQSATDPSNVAEATTPPAVVTARPTSIDPVAPRHDAALASPPPLAAATEAAEPVTAKPVLRVHYPHGSSRAEANARSLTARIGANLASSDIEAQTNLPSDAVIKFSDERNHALARMIGKSLGDSGYSWKIENTSGSVGSQQNMIEVWLPVK
jgi:hypothetical protein